TAADGAVATAVAVSGPVLPKLYIYDHCPFCARARMILGLKKIDHELIFLANHDEATPIGLVGSKQVPILQPPGEKAFPESMDIVRYVDAHWGGPPVLHDASGRDDLAQWLKDSAKIMQLITHPRSHAAPLAEFALARSRDYYRHKKEAHIGMSFQDALARSPQLVAELNVLLDRLAYLFHSNRSFNPEGLSYDDIDLFGRLRGLTLVKGLKWPPKLRQYVDHMSVICDVPLLDAMAQL
ncbi:hypothetical protein HK405_011852, partial [Cladochytrium tenue]